MKQTALNKVHKEAGAKMVEFAGYEMPIEYSGIRNEHMAVRNAVGVFDVSHMGEFWVKGPNALDLVKKVSSNDPSILKPGQAQYTCFPNGRGGIVDDFLVYCFDPEKYLMVVNASNIQKDWEWVNLQNEFGAELENVSDNMSQLAVQGPDALKTLQKLTEINLQEIKFYSFETGGMAGIEDVIISATGYTGAGGFELYCKNEDAEKLWLAVFEAGEEFGIKPIGLGARDTLRLEMGYCLYGNDIDDSTSPIEAGLGWITKFNNGRQFIDRDFLMMQKNEGVKRRLRGFVLLEKGIPRHGYELVDYQGSVIGQVTSGTMSPVLNKGIGLGYIAKEYAAFGTGIYVNIRNKSIPAEIVKLPFI
ncbi:glycine cleavage system aminomethyltransferase GcvT [Mariniphaga sp.]|uniref:glycine cleavage system aminomethyltransferase GcvT n=1 Tax=Mariniphaga sp. TaxID=1954475 RepID=UPI0035670EC6